jgi:hypothetical protein
MTRRRGPLCGQHHRSRVHLPAGDSRQGIERGERPSVSNRPRTRRLQVEPTEPLNPALIALQKSPCRNCLAETDCPQVLGASRRAVACQAANKNHPEHPTPPGRHCRPGRTNPHDIRSRRAGEAPAWAAGFGAGDGNRRTGAQGLYLIPLRPFDKGCKTSEYRGKSIPTD